MPPACSTMCLIAVALNCHPDYPLILAANRDEFLQRPTEPMHVWPQPQGLIAGRDRQAGGTWLASGADGRLAAVTNVRDQRLQRKGPSRGRLAVDFVSRDQPINDWLAEVRLQDNHRAGYNLLLFELRGRQPLGCWHSNAPGSKTSTLDSGIHVLSNAGMNDPWPKVERLRECLERCLSIAERQTLQARLLAALLDTRPAPRHQLPDTGVGIETEQGLSAPFIRLPGYATRSTTLALFDQQRQLELIEYRHQQTVCEDSSRYVRQL